MAADVDERRDRDRLVRLGSLHVDITGEALRRLTLQQRDTLILLTQDSAWSDVAVGTAWDLPEGWVTFSFSYENGAKLYGGIEPEGRAHT